MRPLGAMLAVSLALAQAAFAAAADDAKDAKADAKEAEKAPDGKPIFIKYKCIMCHEIGSQGILKQGNTKADTTWMTTVGRAPDLSGVGRVHGEKWFRGWLQRTETIHDRRHLLKFRGSDVELAVLVQWLESLDDEKAGKALKTREENLK